MAALDTGLIVVLAIAGVFILWYVVGGVSNWRRGRHIANGVRDVLATWGCISRVQSYGTAAVRLTADGADAPFRTISLAVSLKPRELPVTWALAQVQRRGDTCIVEATLRQTPRIGFEVVDPTTRFGRRRAQAKSGWSRSSLGGREYLISAKNEAGVERLLRDVPGSLLTRIEGLRVTAGTDAGFVAAFAFNAGQISAELEALRNLATTITSESHG